MMLRLPPSLVDATRRAVGAPLEYPSGLPQAAGGSVILAPLEAEERGLVLNLPAREIDGAGELIRHISEARPPSIDSAIDQRSAQLVTLYGGELGKFSSFAEYHFGQIAQLKQLARQNVLDMIDRYRRNGGRLTSPDFAEMMVRRRAAEDVLKSWMPPVYKFKIWEELAFQKEAIQVEVAARSLPPGRATQIMQAEWQQMMARYKSGFTSKAVRVSKKWAQGFARASKLLVVVEFTGRSIELMLSKNEKEASDICAELAAMAGGLIGAALAAELAKGVVIGLGVILGFTPAGWVVLGAGLVAGVAAGVYLPEAIDGWTKSFLEGAWNPYAPQP